MQYDDFYLKKGYFGRPGFTIGLSMIALFRATGDSSFLAKAAASGRQLEKRLPPSGIVPILKTTGDSIVQDSGWVAVCNQADLLCLASLVATHSHDLNSLVDHLAEGALKCIDAKTGLAYEQVDPGTGKPVASAACGYEAHLGYSSSLLAQALALAAEATNERRYLDASQRILNAIWERRNRGTNLIPEVWDLEVDSAGHRLYPSAEVFRFDDMGGMYLRALMTVMARSQAPELRVILRDYTAALLDATWDERIGGGGFRYISNTQGTDETPMVENMYGLFIGTLLRAADQLDEPGLREKIMERCRDHADNVLLSGYGVKHWMIPHNLSEGGAYTTTENDSELGYAVMTFPYGLSMLSTATDDRRYWQFGRQLFDTLLERHVICDTTRTPPGFVDVVETAPPFGPETEYYSRVWCKQFLFAPAHILFASVIPGPGVTIDWYHGGAPITFGLNSGMPVWDPQNVWIDAAHHRFHFTAIAEEAGCTVDLRELGFGDIKHVSCADARTSAEGPAVQLAEGRHAYTVEF